MKKLAFLLLLIVFGCGQDHPMTYEDKIRDWQAREALCPPITTECPEFFGRTGKFAYIIDQVYIKYTADEGDYLQTSCESIARGEGDCEDIAIVSYRALVDSCIEDTYDLDIRIRILDDAPMDHFITVIYFESRRIYEIDNFGVFEGERDQRIIAEFDAQNIF